MAWFGFIQQFTSWLPLLENDPNRVNNSGKEEEKCQNQIDDHIHIARLLLEEHGQRWDKNGEDNEKELLIVQSHLEVVIWCLCFTKKL